MGTWTDNATRYVKVLLVATVAVIALGGVAQASTGQGAPPQSAIDNASATWAAKAMLLDAYGQPMFDESPPLAWIENASATWAAKARLLDAYGQPLAAQAAPRGTASTGGFDWGDFGVGVAAMLGLALLAGGIAAGAHYGHRPRAHPA